MMLNFARILSEDLPAGKDRLEKIGSDIERAADYCEKNYIPNYRRSTKDALEDTRNFATQSLGTIAHQINILAGNFLLALDQQADMISGMSEGIDKLALEKVARKAIGSCTIPKVPIIPSREPPPQEPQHKYVRQPINYSMLDHIGHGVKIQDPSTNQYGIPQINSQTVSRRISTTAQIISGTHSGQAMTSQTLGPKSGSEYAASSVQVMAGNTRYQGGTLGRTAGIYRTAVVPPQHLLTVSQASLGGGNPAINISSASPTAGAALAAVNGPVSSAAAALTTTSLQSRRSSGSPAGACPQQQQPISIVPSHSVQMHTRSATMSNPVGAPAVGNFSNVQLAHVYQSYQQQPSQNPRFSQQVSLPAQMGYYQQHAQPQLVRQQSESGIQHHTQIQQHILTMQQQQQQQVVLAQQEINSASPLNISDLPPPPPVAEFSSHDDLQRQRQSQSGFGTGSIQVDISRLQPNPADHLREKQREDPTWAPNYYLQKVVTVYKYTRDKDDELTFDEKQLIYVIKKNDDGWWEGVMNGVTGLFPGNYVEPIE